MLITLHLQIATKKLQNLKTKKPRCLARGLIALIINLVQIVITYYFYIRVFS